MKRSAFRRGLSLAAAFFFAVCGANYMDPYLLAVRSWAPAAVLLAGLVGLILSLRASPRSRLSILAWLAVPIALTAAWAKHGMDLWAVEAAGPSDAMLLGRHFIVGYDRLDQVEPLVARGLVGGVILNRRNVVGRTAEQVRAEVAYLQAMRRTLELPKLIVATDQEGGKVDHLSPVLAPMPPLSDIADAGADKIVAARFYGAAQGRALSSLGVNVDFSPVLDLKSATGPRFIDTNSHIAERAISSDPAIVGTVGLAYGQGLASSGVIPTAKHFPGLGRIRVDTHHFPARIGASKAELENTDWVPFRRMLGGSNAFLMIGHITIDAIDPGNPASRSWPVVQGLIRGEWGYSGVLITDDLVMGGVYHFGFCRAVVDGLNAGIDLLLIAYDGEQFYRAMACALDALHRGEIDRSMLAASEQRLEAVVLKTN